MLRPGQPRRILCRRQAVPEPSRRTHGGARRGQRQGAVADQGRRYPERRNGDDGAAGRRRQSPGWQFGRRDGGERPPHRARRGKRQDRVDRLHDRARHRRADRGGLQTPLPEGLRQGSWSHHLATGEVEDRRRLCVGLAKLRSHTEARLLRDLQSRPVERGAKAGRQQVHGRRLRSRHRYREGALVLPKHPARSLRP